MSLRIDEVNERVTLTQREVVNLKGTVDEMAKAVQTRLEQLEFENTALRGQIEELKQLIALARNPNHGT